MTKKSLSHAPTRLIWLDWVKSISILLIIAIHVSADVLYHWQESSQLAWSFANLIDSVARISVPLFILASGALVLNKKESVSTFIRKRLPRLLLPWLFWGTIMLFFNRNLVQVGSPADLKLSLIHNYISGFWFMPLIFSLYLVTPIIKPFVQKAKKADFSYFFGLWLLFGPLIFSLNSIFDLTIPINLPIWVQYLGYYVGGYYLAHKYQPSTRTTKISTFLLISSITAIYLGTSYLTKTAGQLNETLYSYTNVFVLIASVSAFGLFKQKLSNKQLQPKITQILSLISRYTLGIYLTHVMILKVLINQLNLSTLLKTDWALILMPSLVLSVFLTSLGLNFLLKEKLRLGKMIS